MVASPQTASTTGRGPIRVSTPPSPMNRPRIVTIATEMPLLSVGNDTCGAGDSAGANEPLVLLKVVEPLITTCGQPASKASIPTFAGVNAKKPASAPAGGTQTPLLLHVSPA